MVDLFSGKILPSFFSNTIDSSATFFATAIWAADAYSPGEVLLNTLDANITLKILLTLSSITDTGILPDLTRNSAESAKKKRS